jgi:signal transduction histidine kinase
MKVLLIEDNPGDARLIREMLTEAKGTHIEFENIDSLSKGLERLAEDDIDLLLLDLSLPDGQGIDVCVKATTKAPHVPIVVLTGLDDETIAVKALNIGAQDYLVKGEVDSRLLLRSIRYAVERKQAEQRENRLHQELQMNSHLASVGRMAAGIAHEINNPLVGVIGFAGILKDNQDLPEQIKADVNQIFTNAQRVASITNRMLAFARHYTPERELVNINDIIESTLDLRRYEFEKNNITLYTELSQNLPETVADAGQLQQVFLNIILNAEFAMKTSHGKGTLSITTETVNNRIRISISDDGEGIAKEHLDKIFDPFFTTREVGQGTGLGLSVCHGIITEHEGTIKVKSTSHKGSCFTITLPILSQYEHEVIDITEPEMVTHPSELQVLIVDDEPMIRQVLSRMIEDKGYKTETADNAGKAIEMIQNHYFDVILADVRMPGMNGYEFYDRVKEIKEQLANRIIFVTGDVLNTETTEFIENNNVLFLAKPFSQDKLYDAINRATQRCRYTTDNMTSAIKHDSNVSR